MADSRAVFSMCGVCLANFNAYAHFSFQSSDKLWLVEWLVRGKNIKKLLQCIREQTQGLPVVSLWKVELVEDR